MDPPQPPKRRYHTLLPAPPPSRGTTPTLRGRSSGASTTGSSSPALGSTSSSSPATSTRHGPARTQAPDRVATYERPSVTEGPTDFVRKLARILQEPSFQPIVSWTPQGDAFVVKDVTAFSNTVLPRMYKHQNFSSFVRQLNKYDFHKVSVKEGAEDNENSSTFRHPHFRSDTLDKLDMIKRKVSVTRRSYASVLSSPPSSSRSAPTSPVDAADFQSQLQDILGTQETMSTHIQNLEQNYHDVLEELVGIQRTMAQQDRLTQTLIQYAVQGGLPPPPLPSSIADPSPFVGQPSSPGPSTSESSGAMGLPWVDNVYTPSAVAPHLTVAPGYEASGMSSPAQTADSEASSHAELRERIVALERLRAEMRVSAHGRMQMQMQAGEEEEEEDDDEMVMPSLPLVQSADVLPRAMPPPHVLVVDDDAVTRATLGRLLQALGCTFDVAVDGAEAVQKVGEQRYDLVFMDIVMPRMDGVAATSLIRRFNHATVIVGMTSHVQPAAVMAYYAAGMNDVLTKPFGREGLRTVLARHVGRVEEQHQHQHQQMPLNPHMTDEQYESLVQSIVMRDADAGGGEHSGQFPN